MNLNFDKYTDGLVPAIVQDAETRAVLMLGFMNGEALEKTRSSQRVTFFSRSKGRLWTKGETSGNYLDLVSMSADCDEDTLLILARPVGPVCHTGAATCFKDENRADSLHFLTELETVIARRRSELSDDSYVSQLFASGLNRIAQKVGEEAVETVIAAKDNDVGALKNEAADLIFHLLILLKEKGCGLEDIVEVLRQRKRPSFNDATL